MCPTSDEPCHYPTSRWTMPLYDVIVDVTDSDSVNYSAFILSSLNIVE